MEHQKISILDLNLSAFLSLHDLEPELSLQGSRVIFNFQVTPEFYRVTSLYNDNLSIGCLDFVAAIKKMRGKMLTLKQNTGNGNWSGNNERNYNR